MLSFVDAELADGPYFVGAEFTAADVMMTFTFTTMRHFLDYDLAPYSHIATYLKRIEARPAFRKAMALAGPKVGT
jgi:glutathione S-transferase